jgi:hypothetical protein
MMAYFPTMKNGGTLPCCTGVITPSGTTGDRTINAAVGTVNFAAAASSLTVANSLCTTTTQIIGTVMSNDTTAQIKNIVAGSGTFTINMVSAVTAETPVGFFLYIIV